MAVVLRLNFLFFSIFSTASFAQGGKIEVRNTLNTSQKNVMKFTLDATRRSQKMPAVVAAATRGNKVIWVAGSGFANQKAGTRVNTSRHLFRWASVGKVMTDMLARSLHEQGKFNMNRSIFGYVRYPRPTFMTRCFNAAQRKKFGDCRQRHGTSVGIKDVGRDGCFTVSRWGKADASASNQAEVKDTGKKKGRIRWTKKSGGRLCQANYSIKIKSLTNAEGVITVSNLLSHRAGIQHYGYLGRNAQPPGAKIKDVRAIANRLRNNQSQMSWAIPYFFPRHPLIERPGAARVYSTFGYNLAGVVMERALGQTYDNMIRFSGVGIGAPSIQADYLGIRPRGSYVRALPHNKNGSLNRYKSDNSFKLAGGGIMSTIVDLGKFCAAMSSPKYFTKAGVNRYRHSGAHPNRSLSLLTVKPGTDGVPQCLVLMTNTNHNKVDLNLITQSLASHLVRFGHWKNW